MAQQATYEDVMTALRAADAAGNADDARQLAQIAVRLKPSEPQQDSKYDPSTSTSRYLLSRAAGGFGGLAAIPATAMEVARNAPPMTPFGLAARLLPAQSGQDVQRRIGGLLGHDPSMKAPDRATEIAGGVAEFAGAGALPSAGIIRGAVHKLPALAAEVGSTIGGGVGSEVAGLPGAIVGSLVGGQTPLAYSKAKSLIGGAVPWLRAKAESTAPMELNEALRAHPTSGVNAQAAAETSDQLRAMGAGEFRPTLGQTTGAPGIVAREQQISRSSPEDLGRYVQRASENQGVLYRAQEAAFPEGRGVQRVAETVNRSVTANLESRLDNINRMRESAAARLVGKPQQEYGEMLDSLRSQAQDTARKIVSNKRDDVYAAGASIREPMDDVLATVRKIGGADENIFQNMPPIYGRVVREYGRKEAELTGRAVDPDLMAASAAAKAPKPASFQEIHSLWREANTQYATAQRAGDSQAAYYVNQVRDALKAKLDKFEQGGFGDLTEKFRDFNRFYATKYAPAFKEGVGGRMGATGRYGDVLKPEDVVSKFFTPSGIDDFNLIYSSNPQAQAALMDGVIGLFRQSAIKGGKIDRVAAQNFMRTNAETLEKLPDVRAILSNPVSVNEALLEQASRVKLNRSEFNKSAVAKIANTDNPEALIDKAIGDRGAMIQLVALASRGGQSARNDLARMIAERVPVAAERAGVDPISYVVRNEASLRPAMDTLGKGHFDNLKTIMGGRTIMGRTTVPSTVTAKEIGDVVEQITGSSPRTIWAQSANTAAGRQSPVSAALHLASRFGIKMRAKNVDDLMREAIYNPEMAGIWANLAKGKPLTIPQSNSLLSHLASAGLRIEAGEGP